MKENDKKFKVGLFVLVATGLFAFGIFKLGDVTWARTYKIYIYFNDISGLADKSPVKIAGVQIGKIQDISLEAGRARVSVTIRRGVPVYRDAKARVASTGIIGTKYLDMTQGSPAAGRLGEGDAISGFSAVSVEEAIAQGLEAVRGFTDSLRGKDGSELGSNLNTMIGNLSAATGSLKDILEERKEDMSLALLSLRQIMESLRDILAKTDRILARVEKGEGAVGTLVSNGQVGEDLKASVANLKEASGGAAEVFGRFTRIRTFWDWRLRYDTEASQGRPDFGVKLSPRPSRYYYLGVANIGDTSSPLKSKDFEQKNRLSVGLGQEFFPWLDLFAGIIRGEGGVGGRIVPFYQRGFLERMTLEGEFYGFGRDTTFNSRRLKGAVYNVGMALQVLPWLKLEARGEDLSQVKHVHGGLRVTLEDKDLAYLIGLITLTR